MSVAALEQFDSAFGGQQQAVAVPNGIFTLTLPDRSHRTFRIHTKKATAKFAPGQRILSLLTGPDNEQSYTGFAFVGNHGFHVWKRHQGKAMSEHARHLWLLATGGVVPGFTLEVSKRC